MAENWDGEKWVVETSAVRPRGKSVAPTLALAYNWQQRALKLEEAIKNCIQTANNRETEWGGRAMTAFQYLYDVLEDK